MGSVFNRSYIGWAGSKGPALDVWYVFKIYSNIHSQGNKEIKENCHGGEGDLVWFHLKGKGEEKGKGNCHGVGSQSRRQSAYSGQATCRENRGSAEGDRRVCISPT